MRLIPQAVNRVCLCPLKTDRPLRLTIEVVFSQCEWAKIDKSTHSHPPFITTCFVTLLDLTTALTVSSDSQVYLHLTSDSHAFSRTDGSSWGNHLSLQRFSHKTHPPELLWQVCPILILQIRHIAIMYVGYSNGRRYIFGLGFPIPDRFSNPGIRDWEFLNPGIQAGLRDSLSWFWAPSRDV